MAPRKLRQVVGLVKDVVSMGKAFMRPDDVKIAVVRATNHYQSHIDDKSMDRVLLHVFTHPESLTQIAELVTRRLEITKDGIVALKCLLLIHRLLGVDGQSAMAQGFDHLNLGCCWFMKNNDPFSVFLQKYSAFLHERVGWMVNQSDHTLQPTVNQSDQGFEPIDVSSSAFPIFHKCIEFTEKVLDCAPANVESVHKMVQATLCTILEDSFKVYELCKEETKKVLLGFFDLSASQRVTICVMLRKSVQQIQYLGEFYDKFREGVGLKTLGYPSMEAVDMACITALEQATTFTANGCDLMGSRICPKFSCRIISS